MSIRSIENRQKNTSQTRFERTHCLVKNCTKVKKTKVNLVPWIEGKLFTVYLYNQIEVNCCGKNTDTANIFVDITLNKHKKRIRINLNYIASIIFSSHKVYFFNFQVSWKDYI